MRKIFYYHIAIFLIAFMASCYLEKDFNSVHGLLCDENNKCLPGYACHIAGKDNKDFKCVKIRTIPLGKACTVDEHCMQGHQCAQLLGDSYKKCYKSCEDHTHYGTADVIAEVEKNCVKGEMCFRYERQTIAFNSDTVVTEFKYVCHKGDCDDVNPCADYQSCVEANGTGQCYSTCNILQSTDTIMLNSCLPLESGEQTNCHPIGIGNATACLPFGTVSRVGDPCSKFNLCAPVSTGEETPRHLICERFNEDSSTQCFAVCEAGNGKGCFDNEVCASIAHRPDAEYGICVQKE